MTETPGSDAVAPTFASYEALERERDRLAEEVRPPNKAALFNALSAAGITLVVVAFDGAGDEGQIESVGAYAGDAVAALPTVEVERAVPVWGGGVERTRVSVREAVEALAYDLLEETHGGWEDGEGALGEFRFDVGARTITLDYQERYLAYAPHAHAF